MHIHLPKPIHGWREFLGEVGIITLGVLIASGAEYLLQQWHWRKLADESRRAIEQEIESAALYSWERLAVQPCLQGRIRDLASQLNQNETRWTASPAKDLGANVTLVVPPAYLAPVRSYTSDAWKNALANGSLYHLPSRLVVLYAAIYGDIAKLDSEQAEEARAATRLSPLSADRLLDSRARLDMISNLADVDHSNAFMAFVAKQNLQLVRSVHIHTRSSRIAKDRAKLLALERDMRGACVSDPPLDLAPAGSPSDRPSRP